MTLAFPEPTTAMDSRATVFITYLDYFRERVIESVTNLPENERRASRVVSGWTPLELVRHLAFVELRWLVWGFEGDAVEDPFGDRRDERWYVGDDVSLEALVGALRRQGATTRAVIGRHRLEEVGQPGPRWGGDAPATLERILLHLVQEYAQHLGHLEIVVELVTA